LLPHEPDESEINPRPPSKVDIYVRKHVDYTMKYGFSYILSNGCVGINYNDGTRIVLDEDFHHFSYFTKDENGNTVFSCHTIGTFPDDLAKKV
jgi:hypothetical protein